jgi:hypothetical protein
MIISRETLINPRLNDQVGQELTNQLINISILFS